MGISVADIAVFSAQLFFKKLTAISESDDGKGRRYSRQEAARGTFEATVDRDALDKKQIGAGPMGSCLDFALPTDAELNALLACIFIAGFRCQDRTSCVRVP